MALTITLILAILVILVMALREVILFRRKPEAYRLRRLTLRLNMAGMLLFLLTSIILGLRVFGLQEPGGIIPIWVAFWGCISLLTAGVLCLAIADIRSIGDETLEDANRYWKEIVETLAAHQRDIPPKE